MKIWGEVGLVGGALANVERQESSFMKACQCVLKTVYKQRMHKTLVIELGKNKSTKGFKDFGKKCGSYSKCDRNITINIRQKNNRIWFQFKGH